MAMPGATEGGASEGGPSVMIATSIPGTLGEARLLELRHAFAQGHARHRAPLGRVANSAHAVSGDLSTP